METRGFALESRDTDDGVLEVHGRAVVYESMSEDLGGFRERFAPGALRKTLSEQRDVGLLYSHDSSSVLASTRAGNLDLIEDEAGLRVAARLDRSDPDVQRLDAKLRVGTVDKMSFGFRAVKDEWSADNGTPVRTVTEAQLIETSAVWLPAYTQTSIEGRRLADVPLGALATMPDEVRAQLLVQLRAGRVLSKLNEDALRKAVEQINEVLAAVERDKDDDELEDSKPDKDKADGHDDEDEDRAGLARARRRVGLLERL